MLNSVQYTLSGAAYLNLLVAITDNVVKHVEKLNSKGFLIKHPSQVKLSSQQVKQIEFLFPVESKYFDGGANYFSSVVLANYHLGSLQSVRQEFPEFPNFLDIASSIIISVEDILILSSFKTN